MRYTEFTIEGRNAVLCESVDIFGICFAAAFGGIIAFYKKNDAWL